MKKIIALLVILAMLLGLCSCGLEDIPSYNNFIKTINNENLVEEMTDDKIKIGVLEPMSGEFALKAADEIEGIKLARKLYPRVLGTSVELVFADNQSDTAVAVQAAQSLIDQGCKAIIGSYGNLLSLAVCDIIEDAHIPMIIPSCINPLLTTTTESVFRVCIVEAFQGNSVAKYMIEYLAPKLHPAVDDPETTEDESLDTPQAVNSIILKKSGDERAAVQIERFQSKMNEVYGGNGYSKVIEYEPDSESMESYFKRIESSGAEIVFFPSTATEGERVLFEARELGYKFNWIGNSDWAGLLDASEEALRENTYHLNGACFVAAFDRSAEINNEMRREYENVALRSLKNETPSENVALGFDAYLIAIKGISEAGFDADGTEVIAAISRIKEMDAATGSITYLGGTGDPVKDVVIEKIIRGQITAEYTAVPMFKKNNSQEE